ncbi:unnamed protein product [Amoebophrya sp. A25]|nr:unnamed protein product [Amoebophrya sp. A25]|eukprot:GSA25T00014328001.1
MASEDQHGGAGNPSHEGGGVFGEGEHPHGGGGYHDGEPGVVPGAGAGDGTAEGGQYPPGLDQMGSGAEHGQAGFQQNFGSVGSGGSVPGPGSWGGGFQQQPQPQMQQVDLGTALLQLANNTAQQQAQLVMHLQQQQQATQANQEQTARMFATMQENHHAELRRARENDAEKAKSHKLDKAKQDDREDVKRATQMLQQVTKFNGSNRDSYSKSFETWRVDVRKALAEAGLIEFVDNGPEKTEEDTPPEEFERLKVKAKSLGGALLATLDGEAHRLVRQKDQDDHTTVHLIMSTLMAEKEHPGLTGKITRIQRLVGRKLERGQVSKPTDDQRSRGIARHARDRAA